MRKFVRTLLLLLIFAIMFPFVFPWKDGKPLLSLSDLKMPKIAGVELPELPDIQLPGREKEEEPARKPHQPVKLYRWKGAGGNVEFGNQPPQGVAYEIVEVNPDANVIQVAKPAAPAAEAPLQEEKKGVSIPSPLTVSPGEAMQLLEDTQRIREMSEERLKQHDALLQ